MIAHLTTDAAEPSLTDRRYLHELRVLGAWWCLGSSALEPRVLMQLPRDGRAQRPWPWRRPHRRGNRWLM